MTRVNSLVHGGFPEDLEVRSSACSGASTSACTSQLRPIEGRKGLLAVCRLSRWSLQVSGLGSGARAVSPWPLIGSCSPYSLLRAQTAAELSTEGGPGFLLALSLSLRRQARPDAQISG